VLIAADGLGASIDIVYGRDIPETVRKATKSRSWPVPAPATGGDRFSQADGHVAPFLYRVPFPAARPAALAARRASRETPGID
jgi:hypothetical protein